MLFKTKVADIHIMNPNSEASNEETRMLDFIQAMEKEFLFCMRLLEVQKITKKLKEEDCSSDVAFIQSFDAAMDECVALHRAFSANPGSGDKYRERFDKKKEIVLALIENVRKETHFFSCSIYGDITRDLDKATAKFVEIVERETAKLLDSVE